jgi:hypothetical protein
MSLHRKNWKVRMLLVSMGNLDNSTMPYWPGSSKDSALNKFCEQEAFNEDGAQRRGMQS